MFSREQYDALNEAAGVVHRVDRRVLRLTGSDRLTYLQGLLTNDIAALVPGTGCYAAFLTPQGRMIADMRVFETGDSVLLDLHESVVATVKGRLEQFIFSEDAQVEDVSTEMAVLGVYGATAASAIRRALERLRPDEEGAPELARLSFLRLFENCRWETPEGPITIARSDDIGIDGFDLFTGTSRVSSVLTALVEAGATQIDPETAEVTRIEAGRPVWPDDMNEDTIPLEAGIEDRAISLTKGCYVGQEIIIRVLHRGHGRVARRLVGLELEPDDAVPAAGDRIFSGDRHIGSITSAVFSPALARPLALGYVQRDFVEPLTRVAVVHAGRSLEAAVVRLPVSGSG